MCNSFSIYLVAYSRVLRLTQVLPLVFRHQLRPVMEWNHILVHLRPPLASRRLLHFLDKASTARDREISIKDSMDRPKDSMAKIRVSMARIKHNMIKILGSMDRAKDSMVLAKVSMGLARASMDRTTPVW